MKTINNTIPGNSKTNVSLKKLVDDIIHKSAGAIISKRAVIRNKISDDVYIHTDEDIIAIITEGMLNAMLTHAAEGEIEITAIELFSNTIKLAVKDNNCYNTYAVACSLQNFVPITDRIGGYLNITNQRQKITTIEFSFPVSRDQEKQPEDD